jgi:hypothetical protein
MQRPRGFRGLMSGSARWLMSRATSHAAAVGLRLSGERRAKPGHVPAPDPHSCRGPFRPRTLLWPGPYSERPGARRHAFLGVLDRIRGSRLCVQGSGVPLWRSRPNDASWGVLSLLATWCPKTCPCGGVGRRSSCGQEMSYAYNVFIL